LRGLAGRLPVPRVLACRDVTLRMTLLPGVHGQDLIDGGLARRVLRACGQLLQRIQAIDPALAAIQRSEVPGTVLVHGDYGPNNVLLDAAADSVTALVDWEWAHAGDAVEDLAWAEWIVRMHHPGHVGALGALFDGYGRQPAWPDRQQAMVRQCRSMISLSERWEPGGPGAGQWRQRLDVTESWTG
jgi:Ser/Thr protein kinase RdoA (MazF antagonist)